MKNRSEKLAWELLKVLSKYRAHEIENAINLMAGSPILDRSINLIKNASKQIFVQKPPPRQIGLSNLNEMVLERENDKIHDVFNSLDQIEKAVVRDLAEGIVNGRYLKTSSVIKEFTSRLNINLPRKLPSRSAIALTIVEAVLQLELSQRKEFIEAAKLMGEDVSSLQRWSDLIVKK